MIKFLYDNDSKYFDEFNLELYLCLDIYFIKCLFIKCYVLV